MLLKHERAFESCGDLFKMQNLSQEVLGRAEIPSSEEMPGGVESAAPDAARGVVRSPAKRSEVL